MYNTDCKIYKEFKADVLVDGMNVYSPEVVQFRLYTDPSDKDEYMFYVFPITAGVSLFGDYCVLNNKDCIAVITREAVEAMCNGVYSDPINPEN